MGILKRPRIEVGVEVVKGAILQRLKERFSEACEKYTNVEVVEALPDFTFDTFFGCLNDDSISFLEDYPFPEGIKNEIKRKIEISSEFVLASVFADLSFKLSEGWDKEGVLESFVEEYIRNGRSLNATKN